MKKVITCFNKKGGCGKTTILMALADGLAIRGERVLVVDLDSQMNLSMGYGNFHLSKYSIYDVLCERGFDIYDAIQHVGKDYFADVEVKGKVDIIPANVYVNLLSKNLEEMMGREEKLLRMLQKLNLEDYDYILLDAPGMVSITNIVVTNAFVASDEILIPTILEHYSIEGVKLILPRVENIIEEEINPELKINGIICSKVNKRRSIDNEEELSDLKKYASKKGLYIYETQVRDLKGVPAAQKSMKTIFAPNIHEKTSVNKKGEKIVKQFKNKTEISKDFENFINEFIKRGE